jgi:hypothetical protein
MLADSASSNQCDCAGLAAREDLFLPTKFTFRAGQDHRLPYDAGAAIAVQVEQSFARSLAHLGVAVIDSSLRHGPSQRSGLGAADGSDPRPIFASWIAGLASTSCQSVPRRWMASACSVILGYTAR